MGFMTEISILNDRWDEIQKDPAKFVEQIYFVSNGSGKEYVIGQTTVARTHHADTLHVYFAARNSFFEAYPEREFDKARLQYHLKSLKEMKAYIALCEKATKKLIEAQEKPNAQ